uniref:TLC domain-containing protein n=1 Tax=Parastrongyloides trichosuri TaxID=131310 RepID=A0A0N4ZG01_PARTI
MQAYEKTNSTLSDFASIGIYERYIISLIFSFIFFRGITYLSRWYFFKSFLFDWDEVSHSQNNDTPFGHIPVHKKWRISNEYISLIHALICSVWTIYLTIKLSRGDDIFELSFYPEMGYMLMMIFGYVINDSIDMLANEQSPRVYALIFHHIMVSIGCLYPIYFQHFGGIAVIAFLMEVNSIFLHTRSLLNYSGYSKSKLGFKMLAFVNLLTFILFRCIPNCYLIIFIVLIAKNVPWWEVLIISFVSCGLLIINSILFYKLLVADNFITCKKREFRDIENQSLIEGNNTLSLPTTPYFTAPTSPDVATIGTQTETFN